MYIPTCSLRAGLHTIQRGVQQARNAIYRGVFGHRVVEYRVPAVAPSPALQAGWPTNTERTCPSLPRNLGEGPVGRVVEIVGAPATAVSSGEASNEANVQTALDEPQLNPVGGAVAAKGTVAPSEWPGTSDVPNGLDVIKKKFPNRSIDDLHDIAVALDLFENDGSGLLEPGAFDEISHFCEIWEIFPDEQIGRLALSLEGRGGTKINIDLLKALKERVGSRISLIGYVIAYPNLAIDHLDPLVRKFPEEPIYDLLIIAQGLDLFESKGSGPLKSGALDEISRFFEISEIFGLETFSTIQKLNILAGSLKNCGKINMDLLSALQQTGIGTAEEIIYCVKRDPKFDIARLNDFSEITGIDRSLLMLDILYRAPNIDMEELRLFLTPDVSIVFDLKGFSKLHRRFQDELFNLSGERTGMSENEFRICCKLFGFK
jgi:hypothetical protein